MMTLQLLTAVDPSLSLIFLLIFSVPVLHCSDFAKKKKKMTRNWDVPFAVHSRRLPFHWKEACISTRRHVSWTPWWYESHRSLMRCVKTTYTLASKQQLCANKLRWAQTPSSDAYCLNLFLTGRESHNWPWSICSSVCVCVCVSSR